MAITEHYFTKFENNKFYHVYNRTVDLKPMFRNKENYLFFLKQYSKYLNEVVDTYAYALLGNHFHLLILIPDEYHISAFKEKEKINDNWDVHKIVSHQFKKFFQSYAMAYNKQYQRVGTLFQTPFKRVLLDNDKYIINTITYIHQNAQHHGLVEDFKQWEWSSYNSILSNSYTSLKRKNTIDMYAGKQTFIASHSKIIGGKEFLKIEL